MLPRCDEQAQSISRKDETADKDLRTDQLAKDQLPSRHWQRQQYPGLTFDWQTCRAKDHSGSERAPGPDPKKTADDVVGELVLQRQRRAKLQNDHQQAENRRAKKWIPDFAPERVSYGKKCYCPDMTHEAS